jgi:hypothetical protein
MSINLEEIVERAVPMSGGHYLAVRAEDFNALVAEVEHLRGERAAVVAWLRSPCGSPGHEDRFCAYCNVRRNIAADIERGEHRREGDK